jgi:GntR family transcriptional regulator of gluconate operon
MDVKIDMQYPVAWLQGLSLGEKVACELRLRIIDGSIAIGTILSENQIASEFHTSRSPVREALKVLSNEGLIRLERMGAIVLGLTPNDIEEIQDVRVLIESFVLKRLCQHSNEGLISKLNQIMDKMELAAKHQNYVDFAYQDLHFHEVMISEADHTRILHVWNNFHNIILIVCLLTTKKRFTEEEHAVSSLIQKHRSIILALDSKDSDYIQKRIQEHFEDTRKTVSNFLSKLQ